MGTRGKFDATLDYNDVMNFKRAIKMLSDKLEYIQPEKFSSSWVYTYTPSAYRFFRVYVRTLTGDIDWDSVTCELNRTFQKRWKERRHRFTQPYENQSELDAVLHQYQSKLYTFIASAGCRG